MITQDQSDVVSQSVPTDIVSYLLQEYGLIGAVAGIFITLYLKQGKRLAQLEKKNIEDADKHSNKYAKVVEQNTLQHKEMISEYVELVQSNIQVINKLSNCIDSLKGAIERIERKQDN
jgi:hypothetical protein